MKTKFNELELVRTTCVVEAQLIRDETTNITLPEGSVGTVVGVHDADPTNVGYTIEFPAPDVYTAVLATLAEKYIASA